MEQCKWIGKTFFVSVAYYNGGLMHKIEYIDKPLGDRGFFNWVCEFIEHVRDIKNTEIAAVSNCGVY